MSVLRRRMLNGSESYSIDDYIVDSVSYWIDGIENTSSGHSSSINTWFDLSGNGNVTTLYNSPSIQDKYVVFNGSNQYAQVTGDITSSRKYTMEFCFKVLSSHGYHDTIFYKGNRSIAWSGNDYSFESNYSNDKADTVVMLFRNQGQTWPSAFGPGTSYPYSSLSGTMAGTLNGNALKMYYNQSLIATGTANASTAPVSGGGQYCYIAVGYNGNTLFANINLYAIRIHGRVLTEEELNLNALIDSKRFNLY